MKIICCKQLSSPQSDSRQSTVSQAFDNKVINEIQNYDYFYLPTYCRHSPHNFSFGLLLLLTKN